MLSFVKFNLQTGAGKSTRKIATSSKPSLSDGQPSDLPVDQPQSAELGSDNGEVLDHDDLAEGRARLLARTAANRRGGKAGGRGAGGRQASLKRLWGMPTIGGKMRGSV